MVKLQNNPNNLCKLTCQGKKQNKKSKYSNLCDAEDPSHS